MPDLVYHVEIPEVHHLNLSDHTHIGIHLDVAVRSNLVVPPAIAPVLIPLLILE